MVFLQPYANPCECAGMGRRPTAQPNGSRVGPAGKAALAHRGAILSQMWRVAAVAMAFLQSCDDRNTTSTSHPTFDQGLACSLPSVRLVRLACGPCGEAGKNPGPEPPRCAVLVLCPYRFGVTTLPIHRRELRCRSLWSAREHGVTSPCPRRGSSPW